MADENAAMQGPANVSDGVPGAEYEEDDEGTSSEYDPDKGNWGPDPYGVGEDRVQPGDRPYREPQEGDQPQGDDQQSPLERASQYLQDAELSFIQSLPPTQQGYFVNALNRIENVYKSREDEVANYQAELSEAAQQLGPMVEMHDILSPKMGEIGFDNVSEYMQSLVEADIAFAENPTYAIINVMEHYGIKLDDLYNDALIKFRKEGDPYYQQAQAEKAKKEEYEDYLAGIAAQKEQEQEAEATQFFNEQIQAFMSEQDEYGYTHPYFSMVEGKMSELMAQQQNYDLEDLYQQACWLDPDVRNDMIAQGYTGGGYDTPQFQQPPSQYTGGNPNPASQVAKFATSNSPGDSYPVFGKKDNFQEIWDRNYQKIYGR
jgi:hypothetical protein